MQALKIASVKNKDEGDLKHLSLHFLIPRGTLLAPQNKSLPVTNARRPINLLTSVWRMEMSVDPTKLGIYTSWWKATSAPVIYTLCSM